MSNAEIASRESALVVRKTVSASPSAVFQALIDPAVLKQWMGPGNVECVAAETDPTVGGRFRIHMHSDDGDHIAVGEYLEIVPNQKLIFTWSWETGTVKNTLVTVTLKPAGNATNVELLHERLPDPDAVAKHTGGWTSCLDNLATLYQGD